MLKKVSKAKCITVQTFKDRLLIFQANYNILQQQSTSCKERPSGRGPLVRGTIYFEVTTQKTIYYFLYLHVCARRHTSIDVK